LRRLELHRALLLGLLIRGGILGFLKLGF